MAVTSSARGSLGLRKTVILCAYGSPTLAGRSALGSLINAVRREAPHFDVVDAYLDTQQPHLTDVIRSVSGPKIVVPLILGYDRAVQQAIVDGLDEPSDDVTLTPPVGPDWVLAELGVRRLIEAGAKPGDTILLAVDDADSDRAMSEVSKAARLLSAVWGGRVHIGAIHGTKAPLADALDVARAYNQRVVVSLYALAATAAANSIGRLGADVVTAPLLNAGLPEPRLIALVLSRINSRSSTVVTTADVQLS